MANFRLGGWTRIWIALSVAWGIVCLLGYSRVVDQTIQTANKNYAEAAAIRHACADSSKSHDPMSDDAIFARLSHCENVPTEFVARSKRDAELSEARPAALGATFPFFVWPVGVTGLCFLVVGWIRRGFTAR